MVTLFSCSSYLLYHYNACRMSHIYEDLGKKIPSRDLSVGSNDVNFCLLYLKFWALQFDIY